MNISASVLAINFLQTKPTLAERYFRRKIINPSNLSNAFDRLQSVGVTGIELLLTNGFSSSDIRIIQKMFRKIPINSIHQPVRAFSLCKNEELKTLFEASSRLGAKRLVLHSDMAGNQLFNAAYVSNVLALEKKFGIYACFENMQIHHVVWRNPLYWDAETFQTRMRKNNFHINLDTTHMGQAGGDIISFFKENKDLIENIHISDFFPHMFSKSLFPTYKFHLPLGEGKLPIVSFLKTIKKEKYTGNITMEIHGTLDDLYESAKMIRKYTT